jgi:hypothetical protein
MPQLSSTDPLIMAANYMTDALNHPHHDVPLATIGDYTITAQAQLATIFKNKFQKPLASEITQAPLKATLMSFVGAVVVAVAVVVLAIRSTSKLKEL